MRFPLGERLRRLLSLPSRSPALYDDLEDLLVEADVGPAAAAALVAELGKKSREERALTDDEVIALLKSLIRPWLKTAALPFTPGVLNVVLVCGVNGVGKTTTIAKLAHHFRTARGATQIMFAAADTFRAAAVEQLALWGDRLGIKVVRQAPGADPGAVAFDALASARHRGADLLFIDTSGRMHNKEHLVKELVKIERVVAGRAAPDTTRHRLLVIDATTGQNAVRQAEAFREALGIDSIVLAKFDSSAKGGAVVSIGRELGIPFSFVGRGEKLTDIEPFDAEAFLTALFEVP